MDRQQSVSQSVSQTDRQTDRLFGNAETELEPKTEGGKVMGQRATEIEFKA